MLSFKMELAHKDTLLESVRKNELNHLKDLKQGLNLETIKCRLLRQSNTHRKTFAY